MRKKFWLFEQMTGDGATGSAGTSQTGAQVPGQQTQTSATPEAPAIPPNPMQAFNDMIQAAKQPQSPATQTAQQAPPVDTWAISPDSMRSSAKAISDALATTIDPATVQQALQGDAQAFQSVIGNAIQLAYMASVQQATAIAKNAVSQQLSQFDSGLESKFSTWQTSNNVMGDPRMADPAIAAMVNPMIPMIKQANPGATPQQLSDIVTKMLDAMGARLGAKQQEPTTPATSQPDAVNWSAIFSTK